MKFRLFSSLVAAACVLPLAARGADEAKTTTPTPAVKTPAAAPDTATTKPTKGRLPPYYGKLPVSAEQKAKIYEVESTFAPRIKDLREQLAALEAQRDEQIKAVLTPEQLDRLKALTAEAKGNRKGKGSAAAPVKSTDTKTSDSKAPETPSSATPAPAAK